MIHRAMSAGLIVALGSVSFWMPRAAIAQWSMDPAVNLAIATGPSDQADAKIVASPGDGAWIGWFQSTAAPVNYQMRVQRLDAQGNPQFAFGGIVASNLNNDTAIFGWSMASDASGNAYLAFSDRRNGASLDVNVQKVLPDGTMPWGANGISLSNNPDFEAAPAVCVASDGDVVVAWGRDPSSGAGDLRVQRIAPDGTLRYAAGGLVVPNTGAGQPGFVRIVPSTDGDVVLIWLRDISTFSSPRHIWAQRISVAGSALWNGGTPVIVLAQPLPIAVFPEVAVDGSGGAVVAWHRSAGVRSVVETQRVLSNGLLGFPAAVTGLEASTNITRYRYSPSLTFNSTDQSITLFFDERTSDQSQRGVYGQRFDSLGARQWGAEGALIVALSQPNATGRVRHRTLSDGGAIVTYFVDEAFGSPNDSIRATRVDGSGAIVWAPSSREVCSTQSSKDDPELLALADDALALVWADGRNGSNDTYAQRLNADGTVGPPPAPLPCPGDANGDGMVSFADITSVLENWGLSGDPYRLGDADGSGVVDFADITSALSNFGVPCP